VKPPPMSKDVLLQRRLANRALEVVLDQIGMGAIALKFNPDDPTQICPDLAGHWRFAADWRTRKAPTAMRGQPDIGVAMVELLDGGLRARVVIRRVRELVRPVHRAEFEPQAVGVMPGRVNDLDLEVDLEDVINEQLPKLANAPQKYLYCAMERRFAPPITKRCVSKVGRTAK